MSYEPIDVARPPTWRMRRRPVRASIARILGLAQVSCLLSH